MPRKLTNKGLRKKLDKVRSIYIRKREANWKDEIVCFTCPRRMHWKEADAGHFFLRQHDWTTELGGDERNIQAQCSGCNRYMRGRPQTFALNLTKKYGNSILEELQSKKDTPKKWKIPELEALIEKYK